MITRLPQSEFMSIKEYAAIRGVNARTIMLWIRDGILKAEQPRGRKGRWFIRRETQARAGA